MNLRTDFVEIITNPRTPGSEDFRFPWNFSNIRDFSAFYEADRTELIEARRNLRVFKLIRDDGGVNGDEFRSLLHRFLWLSWHIDEAPQWTGTQTIFLPIINDFGCTIPRSLSKRDGLTCCRSRGDSLFFNIFTDQGDDSFQRILYKNCMTQTIPIKILDEINKIGLGKSSYTKEIYKFYPRIQNSTNCAYGDDVGVIYFSDFSDKFSQNALEIKRIYDLGEKFGREEDFEYFMRASFPGNALDDLKMRIAAMICDKGRNIRFPFLKGNGNDGKTLFLHSLERAIPSFFGTAADDMVMNSGYNVAAPVYNFVKSGRRIGFIDEISDQSRFLINKFKNIASGSAISENIKGFGAKLTFADFGLIFAGNSLPSMREFDVKPFLERIAIYETTPPSDKMRREGFEKDILNNPEYLSGCRAWIYNGIKAYLNLKSQGMLWSGDKDYNYDILPLSPSTKESNAYLRLEELASSLRPGEKIPIEEVNKRLGIWRGNNFAIESGYFSKKDENGRDVYGYFERIFEGGKTRSIKSRCYIRTYKPLPGTQSQEIENPAFGDARIIDCLRETEQLMEEAEKKWDKEFEKKWGNACPMQPNKDSK